MGATVCQTVQVRHYVLVNHHVFAYRAADQADISAVVVLGAPHKLLKNARYEQWPFAVAASGCWKGGALCSKKCLNGYSKSRTVSKPSQNLMQN